MSRIYITNRAFYTEKVDIAHRLQLQKGITFASGLIPVGTVINSDDYNELEEDNRSFLTDAGEVAVESPKGEEPSTPQNNTHSETNPSSDKDALTVPENQEATIHQNLVEQHKEVFEKEPDVKATDDEIKEEIDDKINSQKKSKK